VPVANTPTSLSKNCYNLGDGVTWVKVSPGGKESNINGSFSSFVTNPPPYWTAFRDNTQHHLSHLRVSAAGTLQVDTYGVKGDGTAPTLMDSFYYTTGSCPPPPPPPPGSYSLNVSTVSDRSGAVSLQGATLSDNRYVFIAPDTGITRVSFYFDNPNMTGTRVKSRMSNPMILTVPRQMIRRWPGIPLNSAMAVTRSRRRLTRARMVAMWSAPISP
jgi:hypothetical protein